MGKEGDISIIKGKGTNAWNEDEREEQEIQSTGEEETRILKIHRSVLVRPEVWGSARLFDFASCQTRSNLLPSHQNETRLSRNP